MKYAFYPGCVSRGACPELFEATIQVCYRLGIEPEFDPMRSASCTGAGVLQEKNQRLGDTLNARTFALAERTGLPLMTICSTCQGVMSQANERLKADSAYLAEINADLSEEGLEYRGTVVPRHLLWILIEDVGLDILKSMVVRPLTGFKAAPFYGCYIIRPSSALGFDENPEREDSLERVIEAVGAEVVDFPGKTLCCGFPILTINETNALRMVGKHTIDAKRGGADAMVTPCPLCHLNLDGYQPKASSQVQRQIEMPIIHLPQLVGMALGIPSIGLRLGKHIISTYDMLMKLGIRV